MRKAGRVVYYRLVDEHIRQLIAVGLSHAHEPAGETMMLPQGTEQTA
jgi:hypothetical protein